MTTAAIISAHAPLEFGRRTGRKTVVTPVWEGAEVASRTRRAGTGEWIGAGVPVAAVHARRWAVRLDRRNGSGGGAGSPPMRRLLRLTLLSHDILEAILDGRQPGGLTLPVAAAPLPLAWRERWAALLAR
jgi:hypothetical protein